MYCSSCGSAITPHLTYCNRCGARVNGRAEPPAKVADFPESLVGAMVGLFVLGLGVIIGLMAVMKNVVNFDSGIILAITFFTLTLLIILEAVFIYLLFSARKSARQRFLSEEFIQNTTKELRESHTPMLSEPMPSVTEHTTRAFEPIYREHELK
jgi:predicted amidophosphoribosyltransferase